MLWQCPLFTVSKANRASYQDRGHGEGPPELGGPDKRYCRGQQSRVFNDRLFCEAPCPNVYSAQYCSANLLFCLFLEEKEHSCLCYLGDLCPAVNTTLTG